MDLSMKMWRDIPSVVRHHVREKNINWPMTIWLTYVHGAAIVGLTCIPHCRNETLLWAYLLGPISGFGITVGVHRLWSHRSYEASFIVRLVLMLCNTIANQGSIIHWAKDHRVHHRHSETNKDPHNASRGFFFAHVGWLMLKKERDVVEAGRKLDFSDLTDDPLLQFQQRVDPWFALYMCFIMPAQVASYFWGEEFWNGFFVAGGLRYCVVFHATWLVNSAAHLYGDHPYDSNSRPAENPFVSFWAIGEGWHNWHHKYPFDYAASEFGVSSQFNPSKLLIDVLAAVGLVWGRKRGTGAWEMRKVRRDYELANGNGVQISKVSTTSPMEAQDQIKVD